MCDDGPGCHGHSERGCEKQCTCLAGGRLRGFLQPCLLLLLLQRPSHGYELIERIAENHDMPEADTGLVYRTLRQMEQGGLVTSEWDTVGQGPARRQYRATAEGIEFLRGWAAEIAQMRRHLESFLKTYAELFQD